MKSFFFLFLLYGFQACSQTPDTNTARSHDQSCEGCEAIHESLISFDKLNNTDTLPGYMSQGNRLHVSGTIYRSDGKTPAVNTVLYIYHTDRSGIYPTKGDEKGWGKRHGYLRGWIRTGNDGKYSFYTIRPASYPNSTAPAHIHMIVKEADGKEYWIDDIVFDDDPFVNAGYRNSVRSQGGNGIIKTTKNSTGEIEYAIRDIVLGKNIPGYQ